VTPQERRVWEQVERQARHLAPELRAAIFALYREAAAAVSDAEILRLLARGDIESVVTLLTDAIVTPAAAQPYREALRAGMVRAAQRGVLTLPLPRALVADVAFDFLNPRIVDAARVLETRALGTLTETTAETVRQVVTRGLTDGVNPRTLVPQLRQSLALAPHQERAVANFRARLLGGPRASVYAGILPHRNAAGELIGGLQLRDRRFDAMLRRVIRDGERLSPAQVDRMTEAYRKRALAQITETHARTAALDATRAGQRASWEAAIEGGELDRRKLTKRWVTTIDGRQRPEHEAANGTVVQFDERFPVDGGVMVPGENAYNCRCVAVYRYRP
jgi:hypothetical protein